MHSTLRIAQVAPIWHACPPDRYGGAERSVHTLSEELLRQGHQVTLFATTDSKTNARLHSVCRHGVVEMMQKGEAYEYHGYAVAHATEALRESSSFDIIHFHLGCAAIPLSQFSRVPCLHTLRTAITNDDIWMLDQYSEVPVSAISRDQIARLPPTRQTTIPVIHNGLDFDRFECSEFPGRYLAFLGRMRMEKNPVGAIGVAKEVGMSIVLAGAAEDALETAYFEQEVKPLIDGTAVKYLGRVDHRQKNQLLKNAAALLFPIQWDEPFGNVMIEAMACGTPVLALKRGAVAEVVDHGKTGFVADSIHELADLVTDALRLDRKRIRTHAMARFGHATMASNYTVLYHYLLGPK